MQFVGEYRITSAEKDALALLERPRLESAVRNAIYEALAELSTKDGVSKLLELARGGDNQAAKAIEKCTPAGAEVLIADLTPDAEPFDYAVYKAAAQICGIRNVKPQKYFENAKPRLKEEEVERVRGLVQDAAKRWKEMQNDAGGPAQ